MTESGQNGWCIAALCDAGSAIPALAEIMQAEWPDYYGPDGPGDARADLGDRSRRAGLPFGLVMLSDRGIPVATATLAETSHGAEGGEGPWIVGLVTANEWRRRGIAAALVAAVETSARTARFSRLYCTTATARGLLLRLGWVALRDLADGYTIFACDLN
ncbi:MAG: GNAT family N-acetyltransferase [Rhodobacterales bacterium]|jgi:GNAT superfamily N-acetyltransferase|nr:GNAT family N-acetyltransferase [Rhodobacterales bacterium]